jgi:hypothetical protein
VDGEAAVGDAVDLRLAEVDVMAGKLQQDAEPVVDRDLSGDPCIEPDRGLVP